MIECTDEFIYKKKRKKRNRSKLLNILFLIAIISGVWAYNRFVVFDLILSYISKSLESYCAYAVNQSMYENLEINVSYNDIISVQKNDSGDITLLEANSILINKISSNMVAKTSKIMSDKISNGVEIPALAFTGISMLSGYGVKVNFKTLSVSKIIGDFRSEFKSSGINQTLHSLYIDVTCVLDVFFPLYKKSVELKVPVMICESVLVGNVPNVYLNGSLFS